MAYVEPVGPSGAVIITRIQTAIKRYPVVPVILLLPVVVCGLFGPLFWPHDPTQMNTSQILQPPAWLPGGDWSHFLGTDHLGRDLFSRLIEGARASLIVGVLGVVLAGFVGISLGMIAGYFGGKTDNLIMRIVDAWMSIPPILLAILLAAALGSGITTIIVAITIVFWTGFARVIRGETLSVRQRDYVTLAKVTGCGKLRILLKHIFPNLIGTIMVLCSLQFGQAIIVEASITFLGLGLQPPNTSWGLMISEGRSYLATAWWIPAFAGIAIMITVLGANMLGDWVRDRFDPKLRQI
jgi:peptide/nickel transport system permease protein